jgi:hypothetical protein
VPSLKELFFNYLVHSARLRSCPDPNLPHIVL